MIGTRINSMNGESIVHVLFKISTIYKLQLPKIEVHQVLHMFIGPINFAKHVHFIIVN